MIHRLTSDKPVMAEKAEGKEVFSENLPYHNAIVKKPWGYEYLAFENEFVAIWILHIVPKRKTSMHCHPRKKPVYFFFPVQQRSDTRKVP